MKISLPTRVTVFLTALFLAFVLGWFFRGESAPPVSVAVERGAAGWESASASSAPELSEPQEEGEDSEGEKVDINSADLETLLSLPGIGAKRAEDIIAYREEHGPFRIPEDVTRVEGIGEKVLADILPYITAGE